MNNIEQKRELRKKSTAEVLKECIVCHSFLSAKYFYRLKRNPDGLSAICKNCCPKANGSGKFIKVKCENCGRIKTIRICAAVRNSYCHHCGGRKAAKTTFYESRYNNAKYIEQRLINSCYNTIKKGAKARNLEFTLIKEDLKDFIHKDCYYCGLPPGNTFLCFRYSQKYKIKIKYQGIDRIDSSKGYVIENIRPCCIVCNHLKWDHTEEEFFRSVKAIYERHIKTG